MDFKKYQHLERYGTSETDGINLGTCYLFPKIDGTNASVWLDGESVQAGSRKRHLSLESDNAGFCEYALSSESIRNYLIANPTHRLFGEWLVPHSLKTYRESAWETFYVFDVAIDKSDDEILHECDSTLKYLPYDEYKPLLELHDIEYIPPIKIIEQPTYEDILKVLEANNYLIEDGKGAGEGIVIKNYDWKNKYNRQTWAKIVTSEFKEKHNKEMGAPIAKGSKMIEEEIANTFITTALVEKVHAKIIVDAGGWSSKLIPRLLNTVYYDLVKEDAWNFVKKHKNPKIDFKALQHLTFRKCKELKPEFF